MELENGLYVLSAQWCTKCPMVKNMLEGNGIEYTNIDIDESPEIAGALEVMSIPTIVKVANGEPSIYTGQQACLQFING